MGSPISLIRKKFIFFAHTLFPFILSKPSYTYFLKNAFWSLLGAILLRSQIIIVSIFLGRILLIKEYGQLGLLRSTIGTFTIFASVGIGLGATKFISEAIFSGKKLISALIKFSYQVTFFVASLFGISTFLLARTVSNSLINEGVFAIYIQFAAVLIFLNCILSTQVGILNGLQSFKKVAVLNLYGSLLAIPLQLYFTWLYNIQGFIFASCLSSIIQIGFNHWSIRAYFNEFKEVEGQTVSIRMKIKFMNFCIPAALSGLLVTPVSWYCNTILVKSVNGFREMAFFDIANNWRMILIFIPATISQVVLPNISAIGEKLQLKKFLYFNMLLNGVITILSCLFLFIISIPLLKFYGQQYVYGDFAFKILITSSIFLAIGNVIGQLIAGKLKMWYGFTVNIIWAIVIILLSNYFISQKHLGAEGLAWAYLISYFIHTILQVIIFLFYFKKTKAHNG